MHIKWWILLPAERMWVELSYILDSLGRRCWTAKVMKSFTYVKNQIKWDFILKDLLWCSSFAVIWAIWKEQNMISFEGKSSPLDVIVDRIRFLVASWVSSLLPDFMGLALDQIGKKCPFHWVFVNDVVILSGFWLFWPWYFLFLLGSVCQASLFWELVLLHGSLVLFSLLQWMLIFQKKKRSAI